MRVHENAYCLIIEHCHPGGSEWYHFAIHQMPCLPAGVQARPLLLEIDTPVLFR